MNTIGERLKNERLNLRLSLNYIEEEIGINAAYIHRIEEGKVKKPSMKIIKCICDFYKLDFMQIAYLML